MKNKKHMDAEVQIKTKGVDSDDDGKVEGNEKRRADEIGNALKKAFGEKKHMKKDEKEDKEDKEERNGLTAAQKKLPPKLQAAILKSKGKKHMDKEDSEDEELENPERADLNKDGKLSSYEKARGKAIEKAMEESKKNCGMYMDKDDDVENEDKADLDKDGKLSSYEKARGKAIEKAMKGEKKCSCGCGDKAEDCECDSDCSCKKPGGSCHKEHRWVGGSLPSFQEWLEWRDTQN
jgi:hypothetical protein